MSFPSLESGLLWEAPNQNILFDNDETTCINIREDLTVNNEPFSIILHWDPNEKNSPREDVATYYCQPEFFVNVTHGVDVNIYVQKGNGIVTDTNITNTILDFKNCPLIGQTAMQGFIRSRYMCFCAWKCYVRIKVVLKQGINEIDDRLCTLKVYD